MHPLVSALNTLWAYKVMPISFESNFLDIYMECLAEAGRDYLEQLEYSTQGAHNASDKETTL